jgi:hypothetical protein
MFKIGQKVRFRSLEIARAYQSFFNDRQVFTIMGWYNSAIVSTNIPYDMHNIPFECDMTHYWKVSIADLRAFDVQLMLPFSAESV